jgi:hypothetical protein
VILENKRIIITASGQTLAEILGAIQAQSMILFEISSEIQGDRITMTVVAEDWPAAIRELLIGYNRVGIWNKWKALQRVGD